MVYYSTILLELIGGVGVVLGAVYYARKQRLAKKDKQEPTSVK